MSKCRSVFYWQECVRLKTPTGTTFAQVQTRAHKLKCKLVGKTGLSAERYTLLCTVVHLFACTHPQFNSPLHHHHHLQMSLFFTGMQISGCLRVSHFLRLTAKASKTGRAASRVQMEKNEASRSHISNTNNSLPLNPSHGTLQFPRQVHIYMINLLCLIKSFIFLSRVSSCLETGLLSRLNKVPLLHYYYSNYYQKQGICCFQ